MLNILQTISNLVECFKAARKEKIFSTCWPPTFMINNIKLKKYKECHIDLNMTGMQCSVL